MPWPACLPALAKARTVLLPRCWGAMRAKSWGEREGCNEGEVEVEESARPVVLRHSLAATGRLEATAFAKLMILWIGV